MTAPVGESAPVGETAAVGSQRCCGPQGPAVLAAARSLAPAMRALADENRLAILALLAGESQTVVELTRTLGIGQTLVSHHLGALREMGMVRAAPEGRSNRYSLCCDAIAAPVQFLKAIVESNIYREPEEGVKDVDARR